MNREPFRISPYESVLVDMVNLSGHGSFYRDEELDLEIIGLPYGRSEVSNPFFSYFHLPILTYICLIHIQTIPWEVDYLIVRGSQIL